MKVFCNASKSNWGILILSIWVLSLIVYDPINQDMDVHYGQFCVKWNLLQFVGASKESAIHSKINHIKQIIKKVIYESNARFNIKL